MEIYYVFLTILFALAISDLVVGVSNDAVNFVNSAVGSRAARRWVILVIASAGIVIGTLFAGGMMDIARKGIFNPEKFILFEITIIFLAVMFTDVLLLDLYNTFGLPTSTTVSLLFEMLGAAVAVSIMKIYAAGENIAALVEYINTSKALAMISGILISVIIAFTVATIIQFIVRLIFTFDYQARLRRYGSFWCALALTFISYFLVNKGLKGAVFMTADLKQYIESHFYLFLIYSLALWTIIFQLLIWFTKINILKIVVLAGTFTLALAFAANDLVNFIGVPLAGLTSFQIAMQSANPAATFLGGLKDAAHPSSILLLIAGGIMAVTLWISKKAQTVTKTEVNLGRQWDGYERFESSLVARIIVRMSMTLSRKFKVVIPAGIIQALNRRFAHIQEKQSDKQPPAFDLLRASVNLMVASSLISLGTSLKLPLSTTYVTFMAAMGTSLADRAWGRESAVYRVNGVLTVISGWFLTALMAFTVAMILAFLIYIGKLPVIILFTVLAAYLIYKTHTLHKRKEMDEAILETVTPQKIFNPKDVIHAQKKELTHFLLQINDTLTLALQGLFNERRKPLKQAQKILESQERKLNQMMNGIIQKIQLLSDLEIQGGQRFGRLMSTLNEIHDDTSEIVLSCYKHISNNHSGPAEDQIRELQKLTDLVQEKINLTREALINSKAIPEKEWRKNQERIDQIARNFDRSQINRLRKKQGSVRTNLLMLSVLSEMEKISGHMNDLLQSINDFEDQEPTSAG